MTFWSHLIHVIKHCWKQKQTVQDILFIFLSLEVVHFVNDELTNGRWLRACALCLLNLSTNIMHKNHEMNCALLYFFNTDLVQASMAALETTWLSHRFDRMNVLSKAIKVSPVFAQRWMTLWWLWWKAICWPGMSRHPGCVTIIRMAVCCTFLSQAVWSQMVLYITFSKHPVLFLGRWLQYFHNMWIIVLHYLHVRVQTQLWRLGKDS